MKEHVSKVRENTIHEEKVHPYSFHLVLFSEDKIYDLWLPRVAEGHFYFSELREHRFLSIVARENRWVAICRSQAFFKTVPMRLDNSIVIEDKQLLEIDAEDYSYTLYAEEVTQQKLTYKNYSIRSGVEVYIGKHPDSDICCANPYMSIRHAVLRQTGNGWTVTDLESKYGTYVNGEKCEFADLHLGDVIFVPGARIIVGSGFLAVAGEASVNSRVLGDSLTQHGGYGRYGKDDLLNQSEPYFNRLPRKQLEVEETSIIVEGPPVSMKRANMPLLLKMGGSMVMAGSAALAGRYIMLLTSVLFPFLSSKFTDKQRQDYERLRLTKYTEYLEQKRLELLEAGQKEHDVLNRKYPPLSEVAAQAQQKHHLWERRINDDDFLHVRLGFGTLPLGATIDYPPRRFELETDELEEEMYKLVEEKRTIEEAPVVLSLLDHPVCGLLGDREQVLQYVLSMVVQLSVYHSYDEVKLVFLVGEEDLEKLSGVRYLPHAWDDQRKMRYIATTEAEAYSLGEHIKEQIEAEDEAEEDVRKLLKNRPYYVIFALNKKMAEAHETIKDLMKSEQNRGVSIVAVYDELPKDVQKIITLKKSGKSICTTMAANGGAETEFELDGCDEGKLSSVMKLLANTSLKAVEQAQGLPPMVTFLEMFKTGRIEQLNPLKRWSESNPVKSLAAPVGVSADGSLFMLDLHEKRQGPHGLVAGMTGSGKSEFLITYILSMAVNYHPDEVAFVLIDYKGGGLADAFDNPRTGIRLPHLAGTITNLDGASIQRSLMSIESELVRRQKVFSEVGKAFDEGSMNIYTYQKLYRAGKVSEPMPHLIVVSDEFAELKQQQPEFMEKLISAARIGRSLGVHLILATQKPAGVVNEQIRSNTKFRVCLRVQDRSDSQDMLKRPEAAELTDTGRFYLQVGYNEFFALGQSAWCGADYEPQDTVPVQRDDSVEFLDTTGQVVAQSKPKVKKSRSGKTQIGAVVQYLSELAESQNIQTRPLGLEPLPEKIEYADLLADCDELGQSKTALIGLADDPMNQSQFPLCLDMMSFHHMALIGLAGSGKSNFFKTMLYSLVMNHTPEEVNFYILDLSGGVLSALKNMPHCGAYLTKENEADFDRLLDLLQDLVDERKKLFAEAEVFSYEDYLKIRKIPLVLVVLDGWTNIHDFAKGQQYSLGISKYMREAANYGVRFMFSVNHMNEFSSKVNQELDYKIALQAKDKFTYNDILSMRIAIVPPELPGRGLCNMDGQALEYQVAIPYCKLEVQEQAVRLREELQNRSAQLRDCKAAKCLPTVDSALEYDTFCASFAPDRIPLGFSLQTMQPVAMPLQQLHTMGLYFGNPVGIKPVVFNVLSAFQREKAEVLILRRTSGTLFDRNGEKELQDLYDNRYTLWDTTAENVPKLFEYLVREYIPQTRIPYRNEYCELHGIPTTDKGRTVKAAKYIRSKTTPLLVLFESFADLATADKDASFADVFAMLRGFNIYFVGCFYSEDESLSVNRVFRCFAQDDFSLLFGGQFQKQWITSLPSVYRSMEKVNPDYNRFVMKYRNECYRIVMPCGELISADIDPDEKEII